MKFKLVLALASAAAVFTGVTFSQPAEAVSCNRACYLQYNLCLANTPHAAQSCRDFLNACLYQCNFQ